MKTKHTLENGIVLEVGKKYLYRSEIITITALGDYQFLFLDSIGDEDILGYNDSESIEPYQEPKEKDLEGLTAYVLIKKNYKGREGKLRFFDNGRFEEMKQNYNSTTMEILTLEEAKQRGLNINF